MPLNKKEETDKKVSKDLLVLIKFVEVYCQDLHTEDVEDCQLKLKGVDIEELTGRPLKVCPDCLKLLAHAVTKRSNCPMDPKPTCKHCTKHCYHPRYREQIREVMKYSGRKLVMRGRIDYLLHLLF